MITIKNAVVEWKIIIIEWLNRVETFVSLPCSCVTRCLHRSFRSFAAWLFYWLWCTVGSYLQTVHTYIHTYIHTWIADGFKREDYSSRLGYFDSLLVPLKVKYYSCMNILDRDKRLPAKRYCTYVVSFERNSIMRRRVRFSSEKNKKYVSSFESPAYKLSSLMVRRSSTESIYWNTWRGCLQKSSTQLC